LDFEAAASNPVDKSVHYRKDESNQ
jgi:hypothetical protein